MRLASYATKRLQAALGLFGTLVALVAVTTGVIAGCVGWTTTAASQAATQAVSGDEYAVKVRTRLADDLAAQEQLAKHIIDETFAPAHVTVDTDTDAQFVWFTIRADVDRLSPADLPAYQQGAEQLRAALRNSDVVHRGVTVEGDLATAAQLAAEHIAISQALGLVPLSVLAVVTLLAVAQVARLQANGRERTSILLAARGTSRRQLFALDATESTMTVTLGGLLGTSLALGVTVALGGARHWGAVLLTGGIVTGMTWLMVLTMCGLQVRRVLQPGYDGDRSGRTTAAVTGVSVGVVLVLASLALWQLARSGSPLMVDEHGYRLNVVAGAAPAMLLAGVGVVALGLLGPLGVLCTALARRGRGAVAFLTAAQVSRRIRVLAVPVILTVLASGASTTAALYSGTSAELRTQMAAVSAGAPLRVDAPGDVEFPTSPAMQRAAVWMTDEARIGDVTATAVGAEPQSLAEVVAAPRQLTVIPQELLTPDDATQAGSLMLPEGTAELVLQADGRLTMGKDLRDYLEIQRQWIALLIDQDASHLSDEQQREDMLRAIQTQAAGTTIDANITVTVTLRDVATNTVSTATFPALKLQGPRLKFNEKTLTGFTTAKEYPASDTLRVSLDEKKRWAIDAVSFGYTGEITEVSPMLSLELGLNLQLTDGTELFTNHTAHWASAKATSPKLGAAAYKRQQQAGNLWRFTNDEYGSATLFYDGPSLRPMLDTSGSTWRFTGTASDSDPFWGSLISRAMSPAQPQADPGSATPTTPGSVRVAMTPELAQAASLSIGDTFELQFLNRPHSATFVALVDVVPGTTNAQAMLIDTAALPGALAAAGQTMPPPTQLWISADDVDAAANALDKAYGQDHLLRATNTADDPTRAARQIFQVACVGAVLLAATGIAVASIAITRQRRAEVAVLRALGAPTAMQVGGRMAELLLVIVASIVFGTAGGALVGWFVVPPLAQATTAPGQVALQLGLTAHWGPWAATMGLLLLLSVFIAGWIGLRVHREALDDTYREEVR